MNTDEPIYHFVKGKGWITGPEPRTPDEILDAYTPAKNRSRVGQLCSTCNEIYANHSGDSCDYPYAGREWTD